MLRTLRFTALALIASALPSAQAVWNLANDFSVTNGNPNGTWSYGVKPADAPLGDFTAFPDSGSSSQWLWWNDEDHLTLGAPAITKNVSSSPINGIAPGEANLHPGSSGEVPTVRWTAPFAARYHFFGHFGAGDGGLIDAFVGTPTILILEQRSTGADVPYDFWQDLGAGQSIDFGVGAAGNFYYDSTPLHVTIEAVPEPAGLLALGAGLALLARRRRRS